MGLGDTYGWLVYLDEGNGNYMWQLQEGVRKRTPSASGYADKAIMDQIIARFTANERK